MSGGRIVKNISMRRIVAFCKYFFDKRFSTISGTLVYFLLMGVAPFLLWLTLIVGEIDLQQLFSDQVFSAVQPFVGYLKDSAESAASGAGVVLLVTSLYSSTNFFYHLRRSGEIIYGKKASGGLKIRLASLVIILFAILAIGVLAVVPIFTKQVLYIFMPQTVADSLSAMILILFAWLVALLLNIFACPYKLDFEGAISGSLLTTILWIILAIGFTVYLRYANPTKLYGKIASLIIFLLWCYVMTNCLVIGLIQNQMYYYKRVDRLSKKNPVQKAREVNFIY
jgi:YihY family inner membrane protein